MSEPASLQRAKVQNFPDECPMCGETLVSPDELDEKISRRAIWRAHRRNHYDWGSEGEYDPDTDPYLSRNLGPEHEDLDQDCQIDTQHYEVEFYYEKRESVVVEASTKHEAKRIAKEERTLRGEYVQTIHTERRAIGEPSQASVEYLEAFGFLPEDHDVTADDLAELMDESDESVDNESTDTEQEDQQ